MAMLLSHELAAVADVDLEELRSRLEERETDVEAREAELAERDREMAVRLCWKPYMHDPRLPYLLARVNMPVRIVWGRQDRLVPVECGELYQLDPRTLEQHGPVSWNGRFPADGVSAHPKIDEITGEMLFFNYSTEAPYMHYGVVSPEGEPVQIGRAHV